MKLQEIATISKGIHLREEPGKDYFHYSELTMSSLEPISFLDDRKLIDVSSSKPVSPQYLTQQGDVLVSLYYPMIACYVEKAQEGYVIPHYMAVIRLKPYVNIDSRFVVQFINSNRGREALGREISKNYGIHPTTLPLHYLNNVNLLEKENLLLSSL